MQKPTKRGLAGMLIFVMLMVFLPVGDLAAQETITISGKVLDDQTKDPLSFASLAIPAGLIGTVTNADGEFDFTIPSKYADDTLQISMIGYAAYKAKVKDIKGLKNLVVVLKSKPIQLKEVVITDTKLNAREIISRAFENVENNYPVTPYTMRGFYRETHRENNRSVILVEAAVDIYDTGYKSVRGNRSRMQEIVNLKKVRASKNYRHRLFSNTVVEKYNLVISALRCNPIRYRNPDIRKALRGKNFMLDSVFYSNDKLVYVISFLSYIPRYPNFERKNTLYIDGQNYAIYKYGWEEYAKNGKYSEPAWRLVKDSAFLSQRKRISTMYEFENVQGKMYLKYFDEKCYDDIHNSKTNSVELESLGHTTLVITGIETGKVQSEPNGLMKHDRSIYAQATVYDAQFWDTNGLSVPLTKKEIRDLEWEMSLEKQFRTRIPTE
jgi:hypothetical protein